MPRIVEPELLDALPPNHPDALHSRRDLRLINAILGNHRWIVRTLPPLLRAGERALELGAGSGELARKLARRGVSVAALDRWPQPAGWPPAWPWHVADLRSFEGYGGHAAIVGNLIFHHFGAAELAEIGAKLRATARVVVACEPARRRASQVLFRSIAPMLGANHVSLHDARVSIAAGFEGDELARALGLDAPRWSVRCRTTALGTCRLVALRVA